MAVQDFFKQIGDFSYNAVSNGWEVAGNGIAYVTKASGSLRLFGSTSASLVSTKYDERHYFLVPDKRAADGYSIAIIRSLPEGVPPINDLPKRRIMHLPNQDSEAMLRNLLIKQAQAEELAKPNSSPTLADRAKDIADAIDALDEKVFGGILLIGGLVALFNPLAGAAIAAKSLLPSLGLFASKYGLRIAQESLTQADLQKKARSAEKEVLNQFKDSHVVIHSNPILSILERALRTTEDQFDPLLAIHEQLQQDLTSDQKYWLSLASQAVVTTYAPILGNSGALDNVKMGAEDIRFLKFLRSLNPDHNS